MAVEDHAEIAAAATIVTAFIGGVLSWVTVAWSKRRDVVSQERSSARDVALEGLRTQIDGWKAYSEVLSGRVEAQIVEISTLNSRIVAQMAEMSGLNTRIHELEAAVTDHLNRLRQCEERDQDNQRQIRLLQSDLASLRIRYDDLDEGGGV